MTGDRAASPSRIQIVGGSGSGKSTLARRLGERLSVPVHHLDDVARVGGGTGPLRPSHERDALLAAILREEAWVAEGIHVGWTQPLSRAADLIVWLDGVPVREVRRRLVARFIRDALAEARRRRGRDRFLRIRTYAARLRDLLAGMRKVGSYARSDPDAGRDGETREATVAALAPFMSKVVRCADRTDVERLVSRLAS